MMTQEFERELQDKITAAGITPSELLMFGYAVGRTPNDYNELFGALLNRALTEEEQLALERLEDEQYCHVENIIGPLEAAASA
jgi:hypothetical protein